jgi:hypothetical protein
MHPVRGVEEEATVRPDGDAAADEVAEGRRAGTRRVDGLADLRQLGVTPAPARPLSPGCRNLRSTIANAASPR